ncbi:hypothetical protein CGG80_23430 [Vibrio parahaemolyticus]|uniref:hypothetical protein n=1 Tax=Vibrio parahaemolyticus TaxID=670 RepID=UPI0011219B75|nr:hypothetical protein [Vibrio parahaemolyticus]TOQ03095.1 hypothetical protein CGH03_22930 [Vibrio parahaemolyticus]TOR11893.1 hypothetical protein CGG80_23430 [Vibrio parahaemolyticus]
MTNRKALSSNKAGNTVFQVIETDEDGNVLSVSYEVCSPGGSVLDTFSSLQDAEAFLESLNPPEPPRPSYGMGM